MPIAAQLKSMGQLIIIAMGPNVDSAALGMLATTVLRWLDYNNPPVNLANSTIDAFHRPTTDF